MQSEGSTRCSLFVAIAQAGSDNVDTNVKAPAKVETVKQAVPKEAKKKEEKKKVEKKPEEKKEESAVSAEEQERRFNVLRSVGEECLTEADLKNLVAKKPAFRLYDGFEPSGRMHIAQGIFKALNVNKCTSAGGTFVFWVADWFALMNDKMGGDLEKIKVVGQYFIEVWKGAGMDLENVEFRWASDDIINNAEEYWNQMLDITKRFTVARIKKCCQIMGRMENKLTAAQILYPLMQCTDVFFLKADICQLGVDQRKVNMLAREYCDSIGRKLKPVILSHHMLYGLAEGQAKMSKSNPDSAIFMEDPVSEVERKMSIAYCPKQASESAPKLSEEESLHLVEDELKNPCLDYVQHIVMSQPNATFPAGGKTYTSFEQVKAAFLSDELSEVDLKKGLADCINVLMEPVRNHFETNAHAKEVLSLVRQYKREEAKPPKRLKRMSKLGAPQEFIAVVAPCPTNPELSLGTVLSLKSALEKAKQVAAKDSKKVVLYLPDLSAIAVGCFGEDKKLKAQDGISAFYEMLLSCLKAFGTVLDGVMIHKQSEVMLKDPSDYWVSVINVGRRFQLQDVHEAVGLEEGRVGFIVAALMHVGDVLALAPSALVTPDGGDVGYPKLHALAARYIGECSDQEDAIAVPEVLTVPVVSSVTSSKGAVPTDLLVTDSTQYKKKFKQAFCEPGNVEDNPVLTLAEHLVFASGGKLEIKCHLGPKTFCELESLRRDYATPVAGTPGEFFVHPGDLKAAVNPFVAAAFTAIEKELKSIDKESKLVANYIKKIAKNKK